MKTKLLHSLFYGALLAVLIAPLERVMVVRAESESTSQSQQVSATEVRSFSDVAANSSHFAALEYLKSKGIISGYPDKTFQPDKTINRAESLKILFLAAKVPEESASSKKTPLPFLDVNAKDWFYPFVRQAFTMKIVQGYPDKTFRPDNVVNFAESLKLMVATFEIDVSKISLDVKPYPDVAIEAWYAQNYAAAKMRNLIAEEDDGKIHPEKEMTRGDFAEIVYRILYLRENKVDRFPLNLNWTRFIHPTDHYSLQYPFDWQPISAGGQMVFWKQDKSSGQVSFSRIFPDSATLIAAVDQNSARLGLDQYLAKIQYDAKAEIKKQTIYSYPSAMVAISGNGLLDFYVELPNHAILILYCQNGDGVLKEKLQSEILAIANSVKYEEKTMSTVESFSQEVPPGVATTAGSNITDVAKGSEVSASEPSAKDILLSKVRSALLQKKKGQEMLALLDDKVIIETDTIGVGTGPVDYYFSSKYDVTLKLERTSDTLLAMKSGKTTAF